MPHIFQKRQIEIEVKADIYIHKRPYPGDRS